MNKNAFKKEHFKRNLKVLNLTYMDEQAQLLADKAAKEHWDHMKYLSVLVEGEADARRDRAVHRRIINARFPVIKTLDEFDWNWPGEINRMHIQNLFRLNFLEEKGNVIFLGGVGLGKTHLSTALGYNACLRGYSVLFANAIDIINNLNAAHIANRFSKELRRYTRPTLLIIDELGYLPIDQRGADLLFQVISQRYERGAIVLNSNKAYKDWPSIFNNDSLITSAVLDRLLHHADTITITGKSYRMKDYNA